MAEKMSLVSDRYVLEVEVREGRSVFIDCFQFVAEIQRLGLKDGDQMPMSSFVGCVRSAIGETASDLTENQLYAIGQRVNRQMDSLGKG